MPSGELFLTLHGYNSLTDKSLCILHQAFSDTCLLVPDGNVAFFVNDLVDNNQLYCSRS
jgi:hypothetical protein